MEVEVSQVLFHLSSYFHPSCLKTLPVRNIPFLDIPFVHLPFEMGNSSFVCCLFVAIRLITSSDGVGVLLLT